MSSQTSQTKNFLKVDDRSKDQLLSLLDKSLALKGGKLLSNAVRDRNYFLGRSVPIAGLLFFEPSTRTRFSFEMAIKKLGLECISITSGSHTSMSKGESVAETLETVLRMEPNLIVVRHSGDQHAQKILNETSVPVVNAGDGKSEHPTQALLDAMTIVEKFELNDGDLSNHRILFVGDVDHSRVARSDRILFQKLGAEIAVCCPPELMPKSADWSSVRRFESLAEATAWCTVCMGLRIQKERHINALNFSAENYINKYRLDNRNLANLSADAIIMHPGPFVPDEDLDTEILDDPRCMIRQQVTNGVYARMAIIGDILGLLNT